MLPLPNSNRSSPVPWEEDSTGKLKKPRHRPSLAQISHHLRRWTREHQPAASLLGLVVLVLLLWAFVLRGDSGSGLQRTHAKLQWGSRQQQVVDNWGDHVGLGRARQEMLDRTPKQYTDIGDRGSGGGGELYRARGIESAVEGKGGKKIQRNWDFEEDRHGILGGASVEWSSGVVGGGTYLGAEVDMRKSQPGSSPSPSPSSSSSSAERQALTSHILAQGWVYLDAEDQSNSEKLLAQAREEGWIDKLPLRDQVRGDEDRMREAAEGWSRIFAVSEGQWKKSALEVQLEKMVRRHEVVVFSKTTCPHSKRAKALLASLQLDPPPQIVEVDLRPDAVPLKGLLARRTLHSTFPNIILGGRSIGGADDLEALHESGELASVLQGMGVRYRE